MNYEDRYMAVRARVIAQKDLTDHQWGALKAAADKVEGLSTAGSSEELFRAIDVFVSKANAVCPETTPSTPALTSAGSGDNQAPAWFTDIMPKDDDGKLARLARDADVQRLEKRVKKLEQRSGVPTPTRRSVDNPPAVQSPAAPPRAQFQGESLGEQAKAVWRKLWEPRRH